MPSIKKQLKPREILQKLRDRRYSYRDIATALKYKCHYEVDHSLLCRIYNEQRACNDLLAEMLNKLWRLEP